MGVSGAKVDEENLVESTNAWNIVAAEARIIPSHAAAKNISTTDTQNIRLKGPSKS